MIGGTSILLAATLFVPLSSSISITGIVGRESETFIRAPEPGLVAKVAFQPSQKVASGDLLFELTNEELESRYALAQAELLKCRTQWVESLDRSPEDAGMLMQKMRQAELNLASFQKARERLIVRSPNEGVLTEWQTSDFNGRFLKPGEPLVKLESGNWVVRALATDEELLDSQLREGDPVEFEVVGQPGIRLQGRVLQVARTSQDRIEDPALTQLGGGDININPYNQKAEKSYFLVSMEIEALHDSDLRSGIRVQAMVPNRNWSLGRSLSRKIWQFYHRYLVG